MDKRGSFSRRRLIVLVSVLLIAIIVITAIVRYVRGRQGSPVDEGIAYLQQLESGNVSAVQDDILKVQQQQMEAERQQRLQELESGNVDVWQYFSNYCVMGDSRAVGFSYYQFLPENRVLADAGNTIRNITDHLSELQSLNPSLIILAYGLNDVSIGYWPTPEDYVKEYAQILSQVHQTVPNAQIFVNSILPASSQAIETESSWANIPQYSAATQKMCEQYGYGFIDCSQLVEEHQDLYDVDGIHFQKDFYNYWAAYILTAIYESNVQDTNGSKGESVTSSSASGSKSGDGESVSSTSSTDY